MLTEEELNEINDRIKQVPYRGAACLDALKVVQNSRRWISDDAIKDIAEVLNLSNEEVDAVATFYSRIYRKPVGRNVILICDGISCMIMGFGPLYQVISDKLKINFGETTKDGRYTLLPVSCLGDCDHAPAMMINNDHYHDLTIDKINELLDKYL